MCDFSVTPNYFVKVNCFISGNSKMRYKNKEL